jgi:hypothetical protein
MLGAITNNYYFKVFTKVSSFGAKIIGLGLTAYGLRQIWSDGSEKKNTLLGKLGLSLCYGLHMGSVALTTAVLFDGAPVSPQVATAIVGVTALLINGASLIEEYAHQSTLKRTYNALAQKLKDSNIDFQRNVALIDDLKECAFEMRSLDAEGKELKVLNQRVNSVNVNSSRQGFAELTNTFNLLKEKQAEATNKNKIIADFFDKALKRDFDVEKSIREIGDTVLQLHVKKEQLQKKSNRSANEQSEIQQLERELNKFGIINLQCIKYKKIQETIKQLSEQLMHLEQKYEENPLKDKNELKNIEKQYLEERIDSLSKTIRNWGMLQTDIPHEVHDLGVEDVQSQEPKALKSKLREYLKQQIQLMEAKIERLAENVQNKQKCLRLIVKNPTKEVQENFQHVFNTMKTMQELENQISLGTLNEQIKKKKFNFSSITSLLSLTLCFVPKGQMASVWNPLMLTLGAVSSASSLIDLHKKNSLTKKISKEEPKKLKRIINQKRLDIAQMRDPEVRQVLNNKMENLLKRQEEMPIFEEELTHRKAKLKAKTLIHQHHQVQNLKTTISNPKQKKDNSDSLAKRKNIAI